MPPKKPEHPAGGRQNAGKYSMDLLESVQNNLEVSRAQIKRSRQITSASRGLIVRVRQALAQSALIQLGLMMQSPRNPLIAGEKRRY